MRCTIFFIISLALVAGNVAASDMNASPTLKKLPPLKPLKALKSLPKLKPLPKLKALPKLKPLPALKPIITKKLPAIGQVSEFVDNESSESILGAIIDNFDYPFQQAPAPEEQQPDKPVNNNLLHEGTASLLINTVSQGDIAIVSNNDMNKLFLDKLALLTHLNRELMFDIFQQINLHLANRRWVDQQELTAMGFRVEVDKNELLVDVSVPAKYRKVKVTHLGGNIVNTRSIDVMPSKLSAYVTPYWSRTWRDIESISNYVDLDATVNYKGWVLESDTTYDLLRTNNRRKRTRLVRDYERHVTRVNVGDVEYKTLGLMGKKNIAGYSISREFSLQPNLLVNPISHQRIFLDTDSTVRVFVNDIPRQTFSLTAGYYDLRDFPFIDGINFVKIEITDINGRVREHEYTGFDNKKVLVPGITDYSFTAGVERVEYSDSSTEYNIGEFAMSGYARRGINKNYTLGLLGEAENKFLASGVYGVLASRFGTIETSGMASARLKNSGTVTGGAFTASHYFATSQFSINNTFYTKTENYSFLGQTSNSIQQKYYYASTVSFPVPFLKRWRQSYSVRYENRWRTVNKAKASAKISGRISKNYSLSVDGYYSVNENKLGSDSGVRVSIRWYPQKRLSVSSSFDNKINQKQFDVSRSFTGIQGVAMNASITDSDNSSRANGGINWKTQYFDTRYNSSISQDKTAGEKLIQQERRYENYSLSSSFAMANGVFAMGPPIRNGSFVIFKAGKGLSDGRISISKNSNEEDRDALPFLNGKGSTLLFTNISQYGESAAHLLPYEDESYIGLDKRVYRIFSRYRSGALIRVNKEINLYGTGVLANKEWKNLQYVKGTFYNLGNRKKSRFFTDEEGYFEIENIQPGKYRIVLDRGLGAGDVEVTETENNFYDFGIINLSEVP